MVTQRVELIGGPYDGASNVTVDVGRNENPPPLLRVRGFTYRRAVTPGDAAFVRLDREVYLYHQAMQA